MAERPPPDPQAQTDPIATPKSSHHLTSLPATNRIPPATTTSAVRTLSTPNIEPRPKNPITPSETEPDLSANPTPSLPSMDPDRIAEYLIGDDPDLCCAIESLRDVPLPNGVDFQYSDGCSLEYTGGSIKRSRDAWCAGPKSKACREKIRRDKLNDRFSELSSVLDPGRPPKSDKASILSDAARVLVQLRNEAEELKESNEKLLEAIKDLKVEKNEIRDEKIRLKADKERLEHQVKAMTLPPSGFMPHPMALHPAAAAYAAHAQAFAAQNQSTAKKATPYPAFPGMGMWQWLPPAVLDTTQDAKLWSPNA